MGDVGGAPASEFGSGDEFVLSGTRFPADVLVLVTFRQPPRTQELARFRTDAQGEFTSQPTILRIPPTAVGGAAAVRLSSVGGGATCDLRVAASPGAGAVVADPAGEGEAAEDDLGPWFIVWAVLLAVGAFSLGYLRYRRWQEGRLEQEISQIGADPRRGRVFRADTHSAPDRSSRGRRLRLGDARRSSTPPVLGQGWDASNEPTPVRPPPSRND